MYTTTTAEKNGWLYTYTGDHWRRLLSIQWSKATYPSYLALWPCSFCFRPQATWLHPHEVWEVPRCLAINRRHQTSCCALTKLAHSRSPAETSPWNIQMAQHGPAICAFHFSYFSTWVAHGLSNSKLSNLYGSTGAVLAAPQQSTTARPGLADAGLPEDAFEWRPTSPSTSLGHRHW